MKFGLVWFWLFGPCCVCSARPGWPRVLTVSQTDKVEVHLIGLQAYSGGPGTVGYKTEPMIRMALEHIDAHPTLLPNHTLVLHFVDSNCNNKVSTDVVFEQHVVAPKKFGVWGAGCSGACMAASDVTRNFKTTHLAHLCSGTSLSDTSMYPEFARLTPDLDKNSQVAVDFGSWFGWKRIAVVMENFGLFTSMGEELANKIRDDPTKDLVSFEKIFPLPSDDELNLDIANVVDRLITAEARIIFFVGYERTMARLACEAYKRGFFGEKVVMVYGTFWINADWYQEFASVTRCTADEILTSSQGLFGIDRLRLALDSSGPHGGSGMLPSELMQEYHNRCDPAFDSSRYGCSDMHAVYSYDTTWGFAFTLHRWLEEGHDISEVDYVSPDARKSFFATEIQEQDFQGLTGRVRHYPNGDRDGELQLFQIRGTGIQTLASVVDQGRSVLWFDNITWGGDHEHSFDPNLLASGVQNVNGSLWPSDRPQVCAIPLHLVSDSDNVLGTERCEQCPAGHRYMWDETLEKGRCMACDEGMVRAQNSSEAVCKSCEVGSFANETGMSECLPCPSGHVCRVGTTTPQPCGLGLFAPSAFEETECLQCEPGSFADSGAMSFCHSCETISQGSTSPTAARNASECRCAEGLVLLADAGCVECDVETMICPGGKEYQHVVTARKGYYLSGTNTIAVGGVELHAQKPVPFKCSSDIDCPGDMSPNQCPEGYVGLVCATCADGYTRRTGACHPCVEQQARIALILLAAILVFFAAVVGILRMSTDPYKVYLTVPTALGTTVGFLVTYVQLHQIVGAMAVAWPKLFKDTVLTLANLLAFNMEEASMDCNTMKGSMGVFLPKLVLYPITLVALALVWAVGRRIFPDGCLLLTTRGNTLTLDSLYNAMGLVTNIAFVPLAVHTTSIFNCYAHPTGLQSMRMIPFVLCWEDEWLQTMLPAGLLSMLLLVIAPFALFIYLVCKATTMPNAVARLPFLMARFRPDAYWWGLVILSRNLGLALAMIVAPTKPFVIAFLLMCITLAYLYAVLRNCPWKFWGHTVVDALMSVAFALVLTVAVAFADTMTYPNNSAQDQEDASWSVLASCGTIPFFVSLMAMAFCAYIGGRESRPEQQGKQAEDLFVLIQQTVITAKSAFNKPESEDNKEIREMLGRITELSAHDWDSLRSACRVLEALSLDKNLKGRFSIRNSGSKGDSQLAVDAGVVAKRVSKRASSAEEDDSALQVTMV